MNSPDAIPLGEYRGFQMELYFDTVQRNYVVKLKAKQAEMYRLAMILTVIS